MHPIIKHCIILLACTLALHTCGANTIDSLKTQNDVIAFFAKNFNTQFRVSNFNFLFRKKEDMGDTSWLALPDTSEIQRYFKTEFRTKYRSNSFYKVDIDGNGKTDLVLDGDCLIIIMDMGDELKMHFVDGNFPSSYLYQNTLSLPGGGAALLLLHKPQWGDSIWTTDTIVYQFNGLVEYNSHFKADKISKISYHGYSVSSMGDDDDFCAEVNESGLCFFNGRIHDWNDPPRNGRFSMTNKDAVAALMDFIAYADLRQKKSNYSIGVDHSSGCDLAIYFEDGYIKKIHTWGIDGTIGLHGLREILSGFMTLPDWQSTDNVVHCTGESDKY